MNILIIKFNSCLINIKKIVIISILFLIFLQTINAGEIKHTIIGPYGNTLATSTASYGTESATTTVEDRYKDFEYLTTQNSFTSEPFCKFGGQYMINVYNDPIYAGVYDNTNKLYYCKTTQDLINHMKIPSSWQNDNLVLYCNDGSNIYNPEFNLDLFTNKINTYKMCILKNLNKDSDNTLIFGYDAGNKLIDSSATNRFNPNTKTGPIVANLNNSLSANTNSVTQITKRIYFYIPYVLVCTTEGQASCCFDCGCSPTLECTKTEEKPISNNYKNFPTQFNTNINTLNNYVQTMCSNNNLNCIGTAQFEGDFGSAKQSYYSIEVSLTVDLNTYIYTSAEGRTYIFYYEPYNHFYVLRGISGNSLDTPLTTVFNKPIGLSRVALFRKSGSNKVYGYETAMQNEITGTNSIKPVYKIENINSLGFTQDKCMNTLSIYNPVPNLNTASKVVCRANGDILINSQVLDGEHSATNEEGYSLNLFKNIILGIK